MSECIFCKIVKKEIPSDIIYEDNEMISFLDINPVSDGHLLIIPKEHFHWMYDVPDELLASLFVKSKRIMKHLKEKMNVDFIVEAVVGVDVAHFHIHLVPRKYGDGLANFWPTKKYKDGESERILSKIKIDRLF